MQLTQQLKKQIAKELKANYAARNANSGGKYTNKAHANWLGINNSVHNRLMKGEMESLLSEGEWIRIGKKLLIDMDGLDWKTANTKTYKHVSSQLKACMSNAIGGILADDSSLGKTYTAERFAIHQPNVGYVDCSRLNKWSDLLRGMCQSVGLHTTGKLMDLRRQLVEHVMTLDKPLFILDEAGDLNDKAILNLKGLWNELEYLCGWYMMGANGLREKMKTKLSWNKVGYEEFFNRMGNKYQAVTEKCRTEGEKDILKRGQIDAVVQVNAPHLSAERQAEMIADCNGNLRRVRVELLKIKTQGGRHAA